MSDVEPIRCADMMQLHPLAERSFRNLEAELRSMHLRADLPFLFRPFETYRSPSRQDFLAKRGSSRAGAYRSAHQVGLAVDFVPYDEKRGWFWDCEVMYWSTLKGVARRHGLDAPITWDKCHVEHPLWRRVRLAMWNEHDPNG